MQHRFWKLFNLISLIAGRWSGDPPRCVPVRCPALEIADPHLRVLALNNSFQVRCTILDARLRDFLALSAGFRPVPVPLRVPARREGRHRVRLRRDVGRGGPHLQR